MVISSVTFVYLRENPPNLKNLWINSNGFTAAWSWLGRGHHPKEIRCFQFGDANLTDPESSSSTYYHQIVDTSTLPKLNKLTEFEIQNPYPTWLTGIIPGVVRWVRLHFLWRQWPGIACHWHGDTISFYCHSIAHELNCEGWHPKVWHSGQHLLHAWMAFIQVSCSKR